MGTRLLLGLKSKKIMANQVLVPPPSGLDLNRQQSAGLNLLIADSTEESLFHSLKNNLRDFFFPEKLPPLKLTSKPIAVKNIWGDYRNTKTASTLSLVIHAAAIAAIIGFTIWSAKVV